MATGYLLDTCVLSETSRVKPHPQVIRFIRSAPNLVIPAAAIFEFQLGIMQLCSRDPVKAVRLTTWYQGVIAAGMPILDDLAAMPPKHAVADKTSPLPLQRD